MSHAEEPEHPPSTFSDHGKGNIGAIRIRAATRSAESLEPLSKEIELLVKELAGAKAGEETPVTKVRVKRRQNRLPVRCNPAERARVVRFYCEA